MPAKPHPPLKAPPRRPRGRPKAEDLLALEDRLISVGRQIFFREGYGAATMDAVAAGALCSKGTLYARFPSKAELFRAIVQDQMAAWENGVQAHPLGLSNDLETTLQRYCELWLRAGLSDDYVNLSRLIFAESARFPELGEASRMSFNRGIATITGVIQHFAERDGVPCKDPKAAAEMLISTVAGWVYDAIRANAPLTPTAGKAWLDNAIRVFVASRAFW